MTKWLIEPLDASHLRGEFCSGRVPLDDFLHSFVGQYEKRKLGRTYVAVMPTSKQVLGYYTLASGSIRFQDLPADVGKKLPKHPVPCALLARLAVDQSVQGQGLGAALLKDALKRCVQLSKSIGIFAVEVEAIDTKASDFYVKYGFRPLIDAELHLYLPMKAVEQASW